MELYKERVRKAQELMQKIGLDVLLILSPENFFYFTGDLRKPPRILIPKQGEPTLMVFASELEEVKKSNWIHNIKTYRALHEMMLRIIEYLSSLGIEHPKVGVEMEFATPAFLLDRFKMANPQVEVLDAKPVLGELRKRKNKTEIECIRKACQIADSGMELAMKMIREGIKEMEIAFEVEFQMRKAGADRIAFPIFVNSGYRSLWIHGTATEKKIERGDFILIDLGPVYKGYCGDICRTFVLGKVTDKQKQLHSVYSQMQLAVMESIKPGVKLFELEEKAYQIANKAGFGEYYIRGFVHGLGLNFEELPFPTIFAEDIMEEVCSNMTLAVGHSVLSVPHIGGARVEDTVLVKEDGIEMLTKFPRGLKELSYA
ncbi:MAG: Xaa-Pro peptidase family protein [candidate division Zixibacteria bacterium]|nr:Xaa-Pro peptidase family protein [candidate division Zixibacteria bacterium]